MVSISGVGLDRHSICHGGGNLCLGLVGGGADLVVEHLGALSIDCAGDGLALLNTHDVPASQINGRVPIQIRSVVPGPPVVVVDDGVVSHGNVGDSVVGCVSDHGQQCVSQVSMVHSMVSYGPAWWTVWAVCCILGCRSPGRQWSPMWLTHVSQHTALFTTQANCTRDWTQHNTEVIHRITVLGTGHRRTYNNKRTF